MMTSANAHGVPAIARHISMRRSWSIVLLLHLALALSFVCRLQLAFVVVPVKQAFHASDFQIGLLLGPVFGVTYAVFGLLSGWLADFANRRLVIAAAIALWCAMTIACGFASSFPLFALFMMGLAIGEAAITPCALSLIGDLFPASRRAAPVSVYMAASFIGPAIAFFFGTRIVDLADAIMPQDGLILGREAWQMSFVLIGVTVMLLAPLVLITIREPLRTDDGKPSDPLLIGGTSLAGSVKQYALVYCGLCLIAACIFALGFSATWYPTYLSRMWQWTPDQIGAVQGTILLITGVVGAGLSGWIAQHLLARGNAAGPYLALLSGLVVMTPGYIFFPHASNVEWMLALMFVALLGQSICTSAGPAALLQFASPQIRGRAVAAYFMIGSVIGSALGPSLAGWISDHGDPTTGLAMGLAICGSVFGPLGVVLALLIRRRYMAGLTD